MRTTLRETLAGECTNTTTEEYVGIARVWGTIFGTAMGAGHMSRVLKLFFLKAQEYNIVKCITEVCKRENDP